jgi:hypothetical protein
VSPLKIDISPLFMERFELVITGTGGLERISAADATTVDVGFDSSSPTGRSCQWAFRFIRRRLGGRIALLAGCGKTRLERATLVNGGGVHGWMVGGG